MSWDYKIEHESAQAVSNRIFYESPITLSFTKSNEFFFTKYHLVFKNVFGLITIKNFVKKLNKRYHFLRNLLPLLNFQEFTTLRSMGTNDLHDAPSHV